MRIKKGRKGIFLESVNMVHKLDHLSKSLQRSKMRWIFQLLLVTGLFSEYTAMLKLVHAGFCLSFI